MSIFCRRLVFLMLAALLLLSGCTFSKLKKAEDLVPTEVLVGDPLSSYYPSGGTETERAQAWYQMVQQMEIGSATPGGYFYILLFQTETGEEISFAIWENGVGCFDELQKDQLVPDWYAGGEALYQEVDAFAKAARTPGG